MVMRDAEASFRPASQIPYTTANSVSTLNTTVWDQGWVKAGRQFPLPKRTLFHKGSEIMTRQEIYDRLGKNLAGSGYFLFPPILLTVTASPYKTRVT